MLISIPEAAAVHRAADPGRRVSKCGPGTYRSPWERQDYAGSMEHFPNPPDLVQASTGGDHTEWLKLLGRKCAEEANSAALEATGQKCSVLLIFYCRERNWGSVNANIFSRSSCSLIFCVVVFPTSLRVCIQLKRPVVLTSGLIDTSSSALCCHAAAKSSRLIKNQDSMTLNSKLSLVNESIGSLVTFQWKSFWHTNCINAWQSGTTRKTGLEKTELLESLSCGTTF